ncbi:Gypsy retrotransposon integrase-like protein 1 [Elysia marginata]|uniref:Gypsy retrotransposon integrase-like protein 1 n=1 Tax=Elysia marginata TaxID=1093978 RepID=A0AAV4JI60_9GAST|nr:Gypsy retrotransposon integrase-like protein 1 [Elysia marginata]
MEEATRRRIAAKSWLSRVVNKLQQNLERASESEMTETELLVQIEDVEKRLTQLDDAQAQIETIIPIEDLESDIEAAAEFRDKKTQILTLAKERLKGFTKTKESSSQNVDDASDATEHSSRPNTKLPKLELPKFSGYYTEWQTFIDKFRAVVDEADLPAVNKFTYLQSLLQGEAASAIAGLSLTAENYAVAKDILRKRFGRTERIIFSHVQKLLETNWSSNSTVGSTPSNLWRLHDDLQTRVRSLQNLGISGETYGVILTPLILHQLPQNTRLEWARRGEGHEGDLEFLLTFLFEEIQRRERSQTFDNSSGGIATTREKPGVGPTEKRRQYGTAAALVVTAKDQQSSSRPHCVFCSGSHYSEKCAELTNLDFSARKDKLRQLEVLRISWKEHKINKEVQAADVKERLIDQLIKRKLRYVGHVIRESSRHLLQLALECRIKGRRGRERPERRCTDDIKQWTHYRSYGEIKRKAESSEEWRVMVANLRTEY